MATDPDIYKTLPHSTVDPIEALGYDITQRVRATSPTQSPITEYALAHCGALHSQWMTRTELDAFASGVTHALFVLRLALADGELVDLDEPIYRSDLSHYAAHYGAVHVKVE